MQHGQYGDHVHDVHYETYNAGDVDRVVVLHTSDFQHLGDQVYAKDRPYDRHQTAYWEEAANDYSVHTMAKYLSRYSMSTVQ